MIKEYVVGNTPRKKPVELANLILQNDPGASMEQIADVISEWGDLFDDEKMAGHEQGDAKSATPKRQPPSPR